ncbi:MAG: TrkA C-terminal domain-containing protein [Synergistaceae bacterium]
MLVPIILFLLFLVIYILISDVFTVLFRLTGLSDDKARFQVISLLTNSGFTTNESEIIVNSPVRRKLAKVLMLFGYASTVTIVSVIVNVIMSMEKPELEHVAEISISAFVVFLIFYFLRSRNLFKSRFDLFIENLGNRIMFGEKSNPVVTIDYYGSISVSQVYLNKVPLNLRGVPLLHSRLMEDYKIMVMAVKKFGGDFEQASGRTVLDEKDIILVLGGRKNIRTAFERVE